VSSDFPAKFGNGVLVAVLALGLAGCGQADGAESESGTSTADGAQDDGGKDGKDGEDGEKKKEEAVPVEVAALARGPIESVLSFSSSLEVESQVSVFSQAKRLVRELRVEEGDRVRRGDLLLRLQDEEQRSALDKAAAELGKAEKEFARKERLHEQELISEQEFAEATFEHERLTIALADAERELSYTEVRAPISGTITGRLVNLGDQVQIGQELFQIMDFDTMVARVFVPEKHLVEVAPGIEARISAAATGDRRFSGRVQRVAPVVDPKTGTVKVTVAVGGQSDLRPGLYVNVDLVTATESLALLVPKRAVVHDDNQMFVYRLGDERRVERVYLDPGLADENWIAPPSGLESGEQVVIAGQAGLKDGALVRLPGDPDPAEADEDDKDSTEEVEVAEQVAS
jgi:membrane fusion protein (multidrug efflux system)